MGAVYFYHLTRRPLEAALPQLLARSLEQEWTVLVRGRNPRRLEQLDEQLWTFAEESFLPHGLSDGAEDPRHPILLTAGTLALGGRDCLMAIEGAEVDPAEVGTAKRVCILFDGTDPAALERARDQWRGLTKEGLEAQYWSEESGRWEKKAESAPAP
ncbi:DNA polymerase III subunit chi [Palleronia caenipelagi]|uniref:DNA polymerase III subunit chi n=1 Tax=Palleronia caenipelagi TaxID=2489174 RepID=A0A547Q9C5_9RHOB|nr:DNA polymerase III subunit chi [Palleronia caenipelagi]TRD22995.1 DNA polymerase III subunit chi [Palleronia caenipelagi]